MRRWLPDLAALQTLAAIACLVLAAGCHLTGSSSNAAPPVGYARQEAAILEVVPKGTPKDQVVEDLKAAGVAGSFGIRDSIYYCDTWHRRGGETWPLDVALLFDEEGKLYATRPAHAETGIDMPQSRGGVVSASANVLSSDEPESAAESSTAGEEHAEVESSPFEEAGNPFAAQEQ